MTPPPLRSIVLVFASLAGASAARAATVDFTHLTDVGLANGEVTGTEFLAQGLLLQLVDGVAFNVGCGNVVSCLGADLASTDDFHGKIRGTFVVPGTLRPAPVRRLSVDFCCGALMPEPTTTELFSLRGELVATFLDGDFTYHSNGASVAYFETRLGYDAMYSLAFEGDIPRPAVPEPSSLLLLAGGLTALRARRRRS